MIEMGADENNWVVDFNASGQEQGDASKSPVRVSSKLNVATPQPVKSRRILTKSNMRQLDELSR